MNGRSLTSALCLATTAIAFAAATSVFAKPDDDHKSGDRCRKVHGKIVEVQIETLVDPTTGAPLERPRVLGPTTGSIKGGNSSAIDKIYLPPNPDGSLEADTTDTFVTEDRDMLVAKGHALFTPIPGAPPGEVTDQLILTVDGAKSTGEFAGAVGTIHVVGVGHQFPFGGPGKTSFELSYSGQICRP